MFFGRESQIEQMMALWDKRVSSLVTCRGRRRIGKSTLVEEFARRSGGDFIRIEGRRPDPKLTNGDELAAFSRQLSRQSGKRLKTPGDWTDAFDLLDGCIKDGRRTVVLLDEISWLAHYDESFSDMLKIAWDGMLKKHARLVLVLCGSVSSWIRENIVDNGAYMGRRSLDMVVRELPLSECVKFWGRRASRIDSREILDVLSVTGGVPRYLEEVSPGLSAAENIKRMCFSPHGVLRVDFDEMFADVITRQPDFTSKVLRSLVDGPKSSAEVAKELCVEKSGNITAAFLRLEEAGLVAPDIGNNPETGVEARERRYRLRDNYTRFYLKCIEPVKHIIDSGAYEFSSLEEFNGWNSVMGLAFENLVVNNYRELVPALHLDGMLITSAAPYRRVGKRMDTGKRGRKGFQVDLLIQTRKAVCIVEVKRRTEIGAEIVKEVDEKVKAIRRPAGVSIKTALVYDGHLSPVAKADGYFDAIIPFKTLLGLS